MGLGSFNLPQMPSIETKSDCDHLAICEELNITTEDCTRGAHPTRRCNQGQYAQIRILAKILDRLPSQSE